MKHGVVFSLLLFCLCSVLQGYRWSPGLQDKAHISACVNGNVSFLWSIVTDGEGEKILDIDWLFQAPGEGNVSLASRVDGAFSTKPHGDRFTFLPNAGLFLQGAQAQDAGRYYVRVNLHDAKCRLTSAERVVTLTLADRPPTSQNGSLHVTLRDAILDDVTENWTLQLHCGVFVDLGHPPVDVIWTTPSGEARSSSQQDGGTFVLSVSSPVQGGNYSCHLPPSTPAVSCLPATSPLRTAAQLYLDDRDIRLSFLEARQGALVRENQDQETQLENQSRLLESQSKQLESQSKLLENHTRMLGHQSKQFESQSSLIENHSRMLENQSNQCKSQSRMLENHSRMLEHQSRFLENQSQQLEDKSKQLENQSKQLEYQATQISELESQSLGHSDTGEELKATLTNLTSMLTSLTLKMDKLEELFLSTRNTTTCVDWLEINRQSGVRTIHLAGQPLTVYCDQTTDNGGWIVFQRRVDASVDFYRGWTDYRDGFGDLQGNFWLGLDKLHSLTTPQSYVLRVDLQKRDGTRGYATYSGLVVKGEDDNYAWHFDKFLGGSVRDSLSYHQGQQFSTKDRDNDKGGGSCSREFHGAWWFGSCLQSHLNGDYRNGSAVFIGYGISWKGFGIHLKFTEMKIRPM